MTSFKKVEGYQTNDGKLHSTIKDAVKHQIKDVLKEASDEFNYSWDISTPQIEAMASILVSTPYNHQIANLLKELK